MELPKNISRRDFLRNTAGVAAALTLELSHLRPVLAATELPRAARQYKGYQDIYRQKWTWDKVGVGTHSCTNCCSGGCAWDLYVKDGIVWREEQGAPYTQTNATVPDANPRGCQKGASTSALMTSPSRLRYPLKRLGQRGEGRWKRISWDEALDEVANAIVDTMSTRGGAGAYGENGSNYDQGPSGIAVNRFFGMLGIPLTDTFASIGDLDNGAVEVLGKPLVAGSSDDWFRTDYFVSWFCNPVMTRLPDAHYITEARYRGAKVVCISPDFSPTAMHADLWITLKPASDAALALAACRIVMEEKLYDQPYVLEQTDMPLLVRADTRQFLSEADVVKDGKKHRHAWWDEKKQQLVWSRSSSEAEKATLRLEADDHPELEPANAVVTLLSGQQVALRSVFSIMKEKLAGYDADSAAEITGINANVIRRFAREFAAAKSAMIYCGSGQFKVYHGDLSTRAQLLLVALTGNNGRAGGGWHYMTHFGLDGSTFLSYLEHPTDLSLDKPETLGPAFGELGKKWGESPFTMSGLYHALLYEGVRNEELNPAYGDPTLPRKPEEYLAEAIAKGYFHNMPSADSGKPDLIFNMFGNPMRSYRMGLRKNATTFKTAKLIVDFTLKIDDTARASDILLPVAGPYEKIGFKYTLAYPTYFHLADNVVEPLGEAKPEWELFSLLAERISAAARKRGVSQVKGYRGVGHDLTKLAERFSDRGRLGAMDQEKVAALVIALSSSVKGITLEKLRANKGAMRYTGVSSPVSAAIWCASDKAYRPDEPLVPFQDMVVEKKPWPTNTGRQQFYIDHSFHLEVGEELPVHKPPPMVGGDFPLTMTGAHTRWSIHTLWRDLDILLHLQRGEPVIYLNPEDARRRGVAEHDYVGVFNDLGEFVVRAKLTASMRPGQAHMHHAWHAMQYLNGKPHDEICPSPVKVTKFAGNHGHISQSFMFEPTATDRDTRVDFRKFT